MVIEMKDRTNLEKVLEAIEVDKNRNLVVLRQAFGDGEIAEIACRWLEGQMARRKYNRNRQSDIKQGLRILRDVRKDPDASVKYGLGKRVAL